MTNMLGLRTTGNSWWTCPSFGTVSFGLPADQSAKQAGETQLLTYRSQELPKSISGAFSEPTPKHPQIMHLEL